MAQMLRNKFVKPKAGLNFSRSLFPYEKRHSTNLLSGYITPVHTQLLYPGDSPDWNFGCILESAPLISTNFDNIYVDVVSIWTPIRLVFEQWNEFLGESNSTAFTINRTVHIPKIDSVDNQRGDAGGTLLSRAYWAEHFLAGHFGMRYHGYWSAQRQAGSTPWNVEAGSLFETGISILPSRTYDLNWNTFFRNENIQLPILFNKGAFNGAGRDRHYYYGLGMMQIANKLKTWYTVATPAPSLLDVNIGLEQFAPVGAFPTNTTSTGTNSSFGIPSGINVNAAELSNAVGLSGGSNLFVGQPLLADLSNLTVNRMYYALMEQRFANKMMKGRRMVEFYANFFGVQDSDAGYDLPQLLVQKRFPLNISQVIATAAGTDGTNTTDLGQKGAYSVTGFGGALVKNFMATEHGYIQTYLIIRGQPSIASGIDKHLGYYSLLDFYLPEFDHIGPVGIERLELSEPDFSQYPGLYFGYTNAWYSERKPVSDCVGIIEPGQPMSYKTLALDYSTVSQLVISDAYLRHIPTIIDRVFLYPVCYDTPTSGWNGTADQFGEPFDSNRYQFITQFVVKGKTAKVMSPDSEPLMLRL